MRAVSMIRTLRGACLAAAFVVAALVVPSVARGDVDLSNDWFVRFSTVQAIECDLTFVQIGSALTASGDCRSLSSHASLASRLPLPHRLAVNVPGEPSTVAVPASTLPSPEGAPAKFT